MTTQLVSRAVVVVALLTLTASNSPREARAQGANELASLSTQVSQLYSQGKFAEAAPIAERYVALARQKHGDNHTEYAASIAWLAYVYQAQGRYAEAEPLYKRALTIDEKALGPEHPAVATDLNNLAALYQAQSRYAEVEPLYKRSLAIREKALRPDHLDVAQSLNNLAALYRAQGRYVEAELLYKRFLAIVERALGPEHPHIATAHNNLATLYEDWGRYAEAEPLYERALAIREKVLGSEHPEVAGSLNNLAAFFEGRGRYTEAEPLYKRSLAIREKAFGQNHPDVAQSLNNLAGLYRAQGRYAEAEPLFKRVLAIDEKALGPEHPNVAAPLSHLAFIYSSQGRYAEAEPLFKRALTIDEKALGPEHPVVATNLNNLGLLYRDQGRYAEAEPLYERALAIREKVLGPEHPAVATSLNNLASLYEGQGRYTEVEPLYKHSLAIREKALGQNHPDVAQSLNNLAFLTLSRRNWAQAADYWRRATAVIERRAELGLAGSEGGSMKGEVVRNSWYFSGLVKMTDRFAPQGHADRAGQAREMFETAQWAQASDAASSLAQMAARSATGDAALAGLVRERQDLVGEWQFKDKQLIAAKSQLPAKRSPDAEKVLSDRIAAIDGRLKAIDARFAKDFPEYASLTSPKPASVAEVQALLQPNEALVLFLDTDERFKPTPEETFIWVITKGDMRWVRSGLGTKQLTQRVDTLRSGLDQSATTRIVGDRAATGIGDPEQARNFETVGTGRERNFLPFDFAAAHELYASLFGPIADVITDKHLLIVPSGALTQLPFQVLITDNQDPAPSGTEAFRRGAWLIRNHALTVLPSVSSLKALRQLAKESHASRTLIGFGNPLLEGPDAGYVSLAAAARSKTSCSELSKQKLAALMGKRRGLLPFSLPNGLANSGEIRSQVPLPETADELCAVARNLNASGSDIRLADRATEAEIKRLSEAGELAKYRILHFATHGALAGQLSSSSEPGLVLTPPATASERDDGYLSASEIAGLKLDADWIILSACNTAAGGAEGAEALSGLARAFFYAGARALLVSHWAVASDATVKLITGAVERMASDKGVGRAEAMRQSMLALIDKGEDYETHPALWAPFVVVGEGAARAPNARQQRCPLPGQDLGTDRPSLRQRANRAMQWLVYCRSKNAK
jgi:CHAT domain-containing protein/tetratricopeptide (TPR) repeat protein